MLFGTAALLRMPLETIISWGLLPGGAGLIAETGTRAAALLNSLVILEMKGCQL